MHWIKWSIRLCSKQRSFFKFGSNEINALQIQKNFNLCNLIWLLRYWLNTNPLPPLKISHVKFISRKKIEILSKKWNFCNRIHWTSTPPSPSFEIHSSSIFQSKRMNNTVKKTQRYIYFIFSFLILITFQKIYIYTKLISTYAQHPDFLEQFYKTIYRKCNLKFSRISFKLLANDPIIQYCNILTKK